MAFCPNCGLKMADGARFCPRCGIQVDRRDNSQRQQVFEGNIHKCPNCGELVNAFSTRCPSCGFEFRDTQASSAVSDFARQLQEIESRRRGKSQLSGIAKAFGMKNGDTADAQKINLIRNFPVPNTKEDVFEFMILASSNIDESVYENNIDSTEKSVSNAWIAKADQVYHKAKLAFGGDPDFAKIQEIYDAKMRIVKKSKGSMTRLLILSFAIPIILSIFMIPMYISSGIKEDNLDKQLNATVAEIQIDISNGDYDAALIKANTLHFDSNLSWSKSRDWDEQREALIKLIEEKKEEEKNNGDF